MFDWKKKLKENYGFKAEDIFGGIKQASNDSIPKPQKEPISKNIKLEEEAVEIIPIAKLIMQASNTPKIEDAVGEEKEVLANDLVDAAKYLADKFIKNPISKAKNITSGAIKAMAMARAKKNFTKGFSNPANYIIPAAGAAAISSAANRQPGTDALDEGSDGLLRGGFLGSTAYAGSSIGKTPLQKLIYGGLTAGGVNALLKGIGHSRKGSGSWNKELVDILTNEEAGSGQRNNFARYNPMDGNGTY